MFLEVEEIMFTLRELTVWLVREKKIMLETKQDL